MLKLTALLLTLILSGCSHKPLESATQVYDKALTSPENGATKVRVHRVSQLSGSALGESCPLVLKVNDREVAGLQQNQYVDLYLPNGSHALSVRFKCALTSWKKSVELIADGTYQEYETESGAVGQYRMWRTK